MKKQRERCTCVDDCAIKQAASYYKIINSRLVCVDVEALLRTPEAMKQLAGVARLARKAQTPKRTT